MLDCYYYLKPVWDPIKDAPITVKCAVGAAALYAFYRLVIKKKYRLPPGPRGLPLLGNLTALSNATMSDMINEWAEKYGPIFKMHLGPFCMVVISDTDLMTEALVQKGSDLSGRPFIYSVDRFTDGSKSLSFSTYGETWKYQKKVAVQSLRQYLTGRQFEERVNEVMTLVVRNIEAETGPFVFRDHLSLSVFNVIHGLCFGNTKDFADPTFRKLVKTVDDITDDSGNGFLEDLFPLLHYWPTQKYTKALESMGYVTSYIKDIVKERKANFDKESLRCLTDTIIFAQNELIEADSAAAIHMTDVHSAMLLFDVFGAGVDTTRTTLDWIFLILIAYPQIQARMQKEIDEVVGEKMPGKEHRAKLIYTEAVILETLRRFNAAPLSVPHETLRDTTIGGYEIPAKTTVMINQLMILRDPKYWDDPLTFKPERFLSPDGTKLVVRNPSYIPFSTGHRSCPGESLAKLELTYIVVSLLQKFTFSLPPGEKPDFTANTNFFAFRPSIYKIVAKLR